MTRKEFEKASGILVKELRGFGLIAKPCACREPGCKGWQMTHCYPSCADAVSKVKRLHEEVKHFEEVNNVVS